MGISDWGLDSGVRRNDGERGNGAGPQHQHRIVKRKVGGVFGNFPNRPGDFINIRRAFLPANAQVLGGLVGQSQQQPAKSLSPCSNGDRAAASRQIRIPVAMR